MSKVVKIIEHLEAGGKIRHMDFSDPVYLECGVLVNAINGNPTSWTISDLFTEEWELIKGPQKQVVEVYSRKTLQSIEDRYDLYDFTYTACAYHSSHNFPTKYRVTIEEVVEND
jgi:hypothetical protein